MKGHTIDSSTVSSVVLQQLVHTDVPHLSVHTHIITLSIVITPSLHQDTGLISQFDEGGRSPQRMNSIIGHAANI